jgi:hypothetical protein
MESSDRAGGPERPSQDRLPLALTELETAVLDACAKQGEWPAQIAAGVYAGVDFAIANPAVAQALNFEGTVKNDSVRRYERVIGRLAGFIQIKAPIESRLPGSTDEALVAGVVGLVGDHLRIGRVDRLEELRPELVLLTLLPYLGFAEAQRWANETAAASSNSG